MFEFASPSLLWSLCGAFSGKSGQDCESRQSANQKLAMAQGAKGRSVVQTSGVCRGLQGELSFDQPCVPVLPKRLKHSRNAACKCAIMLLTPLCRTTEGLVN